MEDLKLEENVENDLKLLINIALEVGNSLDGVKYDIKTHGNLIYAEGLGQKVMHHAISAIYLFDGYQLSSNGNTYKNTIDFSSIYVLARAAIETYLIFNHLFISPKEPEEKSFRFNAWHLAGFLERAHHEPKKKEHQDIKEKEQKEIERHTSILEKNPHFIMLKSRSQNNVLKGQWRLKSWSDLSVDAGFNKKFFSEQYKFLCAHAHSSRLSIMQVQQTKDINIEKDMAKYAIGILMMTLAKFMHDYISVIPKLSFYKEKAEYSVIKKWKTIAEKINT